jgi:RNA polymerase sigma-70 factor, ECF subfamily
MNRKADYSKFEDVVKHYQEKVRNTCFRFVRNAEDSNDIAQEVFIQAYESLNHFRNDAELSTWIYRIAVNKSLDFLRWKKRKKRFAHVKSIFGFGEDNDEVEIQIQVGENPAKELENSERKKILDWAVDQLPENQKTAITLSKYEGFSNKEISEILNVSLSAVESLIHRAKQSLHRQLYNYFEKQIL